ncbi:MAG: ribonuclease HI family protein [Patescibacteria group bacterium]|nr:ribonuclease HI family protein [Patescibacteria group bacterium]
MLTTYYLFTDGGARGNPGSAAVGIVLKKGDDVVLQRAKYLGEATNNQAEYQALILGLTEALEHTKELKCFLDSELVVKQLNGEYRVKDEKLKPLFEKVRGLEESFEKISFHHISREKNKLADLLLNQELDSPRHGRGKHHYEK